MPRYRIVDLLPLISRGNSHDRRLYRRRYQRSEAEGREGGEIIVSAFLRGGITTDEEKQRLSELIWGTKNSMYNYYKRNK